MRDILIPCGFSLLVWWLVTGIILLLVRRNRRTFPLSLTGATLLLAVAVYLVVASAQHTTVSDAYFAFASAIGIWGWLEMSFLTGFLTGPLKQGCRERCHGARHFWHAVQAIFYNELATGVAAAGILSVTRDAPNRLAFYTFMILWVMRVSAKLNLYLGVPNLGEQFLPSHLTYLTSFFKKRTMNLLFPLSVTAGTVFAGYLVVALVGATPGYQTASLSLALSLTALGLLEHWFMVLPLANDRLWHWALNFAAGLAIPNTR